MQFLMKHFATSPARLWFRARPIGSIFLALSLISGTVTPGVSQGAVSGGLARVRSAEKTKSKRKKGGLGRRVASTGRGARTLAQLDDELDAGLDSDLTDDLDAELNSGDEDSAGLDSELGGDLAPAVEPPKTSGNTAIDSNPIAIGEDVEITDIRYDSKLNGGTVVVSASGVPTYRTREVASQNQVVVEIANAKLPDRLKRPFNTKDFRQAIVSINAYQDAGSNTARIVLQFRKPQAVAVQQNGHGLTINTGRADSSQQVVATSPPTALSADDDFGDDSSGGGEDNSTSEIAAGSDVGVITASPRIPRRSSNTVMGSSTLEEERTGEIRYVGKPISIEVRDTPVRDVIGLIAEQSGANIVLADDVTGSVTMKLRSIPWDQALAIVMKTRGLGYVRQGSVLRVAPISRLQAEADEARKILEAQEATLPVKVKVLPVSFANVATLVTQIRNTLQKATGPQTTSRGSIEADARSSSLIVTDTEENIRRIEQLVVALDTPPLQVMIEGKIVEARESTNKAFGINWGYSGQDLGFAGGTLSHSARINPSQVGSATTVNLRLGTLDFLGDLDARLSLLERDSLARVVSSPRIITMNAQEATIEQAINVAIPTTTVVNNTPVTTTTFRPIPTILKVTPQITPSGEVIMNINFRREFQADSSGDTPNIESRDVKTNVMVKNGQTTVIGGVYQADQTDVEEGTPFLKRVPVLGWLFKSQTKTQIRNELLVFLTPRILNADRNLPKRKTL